MKLIIEKIRQSRNSIFVFLIPIFSILFVFREVIFQSRVFSHLDFVLTYSPYFNFLSDNVGLIASGILSGFPVYVSISSTWFNPVNKILFIFLDAFDVLRFLNVSYIILAYIFTYLFIKRLKVSHLSSVLGAMVFVFSGQVMLWSETIIITNYYFLMPLALLTLDYAVGNKIFKKLILYLFLGVVLGYGWLAGHVQFLIYVYALVFSYWGFLVLKRVENSYRNIFIELGFFIFSVLVSVLEGLPQIRAVLDFLPLTARSGGVSLDSATAYAYAPHHLIYYILPYFKFPYISLSQSFQNYIGILPLFFFILIFVVWRKLRLSTQFNFFFGVFLFCFIASIKYSPIAFIFHQLPIFNSLRETFRVMFIGDFAIGIIVAMVADSLWQNREEVYPKVEKVLVWSRRVFLYCFLPVIIIVSSIKIFLFSKIETLLQNYFLTNLYENTQGGYSIEHYYRIINTYLHQAIDQFYLFDYNILLFIIFTTLSYFLLKNIKNLSFEKFLSLAILITAFNFSLIYVHRINGIPKQEILSLPKTAQFIKSQKDKEPFRIFSPLMSEVIFNEATRCSFPDLGNWDISKPDFALRRELIEPDLNLLYGLDSADGYEPYSPVKASEMVGFVGSRFAVTPNYVLSNENVSFNEKVKKIEERKNIYRAMNVKYLLTTYVLNDKSFKQIYSEDLGQCKTKIYIYELSNPYPRYFISNNIVSVEGKKNFMENMNVLSSSDKPIIVLGNNSKIKSVNYNFTKSINPTSSTSDRKEFSIDSPVDTYFLVGDLNLPGWKAYVDSKEVELISANYIYSAIPLSSGHHDVRLEYNK